MILNKTIKIITSFTIVFLIFLLSPNISLASKCTISLISPPINNIYYSNRPNTFTATINVNAMNATSARVSFYDASLSPIFSCPSIKVNIPSATPVQFTCNLQGLPDNNYILKVESSNPTDDCEIGPICVYSDPTKIACNNALVNTPIAVGSCSDCGFCDRNKNGTLDPSEKPSYYDDCKDCIDGKDPTTNGHIGSWTALGCIDSDPGGFIAWFLSIIFYIAGGIAFLIMLFGVFTIITSSGNPEKLNTGKEYITAAISGLMLIIFSVFLLKVLGVDIIKIPNFTI